MGYYNVNVDAGKYALVAINVDQVSGGKYTLDQLFPTNANTSSYTALGSYSDQVRVWNHAESKFEYYFRYNNPFGGGDKNWHWVKDVAVTFPDTPPLADVQLGVGDAVFYKAVKTQTLTVPGSVPNQASKTLNKGYNFMGAGFPKAWNPNDEGTDYWQNAAFSSYNSSGSYADEIRAWDTNGNCYKYYFLFYNPFVPANNYKWVDATTLEVLNTPLNTGDGFYFIKRKDGEFLFEPPSLRLEK